MEYKRYRREAEEAERRQMADYDQQYHNPDNAPTYSTHQLPPARTTTPYTHKRRDSDTLRSVATAASPTLLSMPQRVGRTSPPGSRLSPQEGKVGRVSPPGSRISPPNTRVDRLSPRLSEERRERLRERTSPPPTNPPPAKHRRSPTAPEMVGGPDEYSVGVMDGRRMQQQMQDQMQDHRQQQQPVKTQATAPAPAPASVTPAPPNRQMVVNKKAYARLDCIGKGGSSRVYRVLNHASELYAIKRVLLDKTDAETMAGYMNEIALLKRLEGNSRIIRLIDSEVKAGPGGSKGALLLVMECGEVDLARLMSERVGLPLDMVWVAYYWQQVGCLWADRGHW